MLKQTINKGKSTPIAIGLILVILIGGFIWWQYSEIRKEETQLPETKFLEEKTGTTDLLPEDLTKEGRGIYTNEEYGFEINYPEGWRMVEISSPFTKSYIKPLFVVVFEKPIRDLACSFEIEVVDSENSLFQDEIDALIASNYEKSEIVLAGFPTTKLDFREAESCTSYLIKRSEEDYFRIDKYIMERFFKEGNISIYLEDIPECTEDFDQMLSTFRFLD